MKFFEKLIAIATISILSSSAFAVGFNHETILHFHNCTGHPLTVTWQAYNFNFDAAAEDSTLSSGKFSISESEISNEIKALWAFFNPTPNGSITCNITSADFKDSFKINLTGILPEGRLLYSTESSKIIFDKSHIEFANVSAINTVHIGCN